MRTELPIAVVAVRRQIESFQTGANVYLAALVDELRRSGFEVRLIFAPDSSFGERPAALIAREFQESCAVIRWDRTIRLGRVYLSTSRRVLGRFLRRLIAEARKLIRGATPRPPWRNSERLPDAEARELAAAIDAAQPRLVVAEYSALGPVLEHVRTPGAARAILLHDLFSLRAAAVRAAGQPTDFHALTIEQEAQHCRAADVLIYASLAERDAFQPLLPGRRHLWLAPNVEPAMSSASSGRPMALFMGVRHAGNLDAVQFLMTEIWPGVLARVPDAELCIVGEIGRHLEPAWRELPGVTIVGTVPDLSRYGGRDTVGVAPTRIASGVSIKVADYLRLGMPVVATSIAVEGYADRLVDAVALADTGDAFAASLADLLSSAERRHARAALGAEAIRSPLQNEELRRALGEIAGALPPSAGAQVA